jgi:DNA-binding NarL/FixJ family response regulator
MTRLGHSPWSSALSLFGVMIRVVLADDEYSVRAMLGIALGMEDDFTVVGEAINGEEAIDLVDQRHPDAVVLDLVMPVMGGIEAIPRIRDCWPETKIVVFSALDHTEVGPRAMEAGADAYIEKTKFVAELSDTLHRLCLCA